MNKTTLAATLMALASSFTAHAQQAERATIEAKGVTLHGEYLLPQTLEGQCPVVVIVAGSGPTDRNCNTMGLPGKSDSYLQLAEALAERGIASFRYDKRGICESQMIGLKEENQSLYDFADDASAVVDFVKRDSRFGKLVLAGHSEGSLLGLMVCQANKNVDAFVSIAGCGRTIDVVLLEQLKHQGLDEATLAYCDQIQQKIKAGEPVDVPEGLMALYRPSVQPFLKSEFNTDPIELIKKIEVKTLIIQGTTDIQVMVEDAELLAAAKPEAQKLIIEGMSHGMKAVPTTDNDSQFKALLSPEVPLKVEVAEAIASFCR